MPRFLNPEGEACELELKGAELIVRTGGREHREPHFNPAAAKEAYLARVVSLGAQGFAPEVETEDERQPWELLKVNPELEAGIERHPEDPAGYLVYADWLQAQSDPRGTFIALHANKKTRKTAEAFLERNGRVLLGPLDESLRHRDARVKWRHGFIVSAELRAVWGATLQYEELVTHLLAHPMARFLEGLELESSAEALEALAASSRCAALKSLELKGLRSVAIDWIAERAPQLERLGLAEQTVEGAPLRLSKLRSLSLDSRRVRPSLEEALGQAVCPLLEELWLGLSDSAARPLLFPLLAREYPRLSALSLGLQDDSAAVAALALLRASPLHGRIKRLVLAFERHPSADAFTGHEDWLRKLDQLRLLGSRPRTADAAALRELLPDVRI